MAGHPFSSASKAVFSCQSAEPWRRVHRLLRRMRQRLQARPWPTIDATFLFTADVPLIMPHLRRRAQPELRARRARQGRQSFAACGGFEPDCGIRVAKRRLTAWQRGLGGERGKKIANATRPRPSGGGHEPTMAAGRSRFPAKGHQLLQFSSRYQEGAGPDRVHFPVYNGLGKPRSRPGRRSTTYRLVSPRAARLCRAQSSPDGVSTRPPAAVGNYDIESDNYSWDWGGLHLVQLQRFGGDTQQGCDQRPGLVETGTLPIRRPMAGRWSCFQHYGWGTLSSLEKWDPAKMTFDDEGSGPRPLVGRGRARAALLGAIKGYNVVWPVSRA